MLDVTGRDKHVTCLSVCSGEIDCWNATANACSINMLLQEHALSGSASRNRHDELARYVLARYV